MRNESLDKNEDSNVFKFISELREEALYISSEKSLLRNLNEKIRAKTEELLRSSWVTTKRRLLLQKESSINAIQDVVYLENSDFIEAKNFVGFQNASKLSSLLQILRAQPEQLARCLILGEQLHDEQVQLCLLQSIVTGLYASLIFSEDVNSMTFLLLELAKYQLFRNEKPQRALKQRSNSFACLYYIFNEVLLSAKYFLSATLEVPVVRLLTIDYYLDIDPDKSNIRYQQEDNVQLMFKNVNDYRKNVVKELAKLTNLFVNSLQENTLNFPKPVSWLLCQIEKCILESFDEKEANAVVTDLLFNMFICPAILNPEQYGICDAQITSISRHNLMQIGQLIQSLALIKHETPDIKLKDLYDSIDKETTTLFIVDLFSQVKYVKTPSVDSIPLVLRETAIFTEQEIKSLVTFLNRVHNEVKQNESYEKHSLFNDSIVRQIAALSLYPTENSPKHKPYTNGYSENNFKKSSSLLSLVTKNHTKTDDVQNINPNVVLLFSIHTDSIEPLGMLSERAILEQNLGNSKSEITYPDVASESELEIQKNLESNEVKINFSNYHDEGSIGNTSDNLEAISEGASNHSVASSLEMENEDQNDNYSDMVSANVSGRGSPNISGRDTPSSQVNENEDRAAEQRPNVDPNSEAPPRVHRPTAAQLSRQIRSEINDKFCKFEIKLPGPGRDETTSLYSETWSTDVLASDNETVDASETRNENRCSIIDQAVTGVPINNMLDISETQSESAWSIDAMPSDTDRLTEVDPDDIGSIAQSDDAQSVAPSDDTRSETDENVTTPGSRRMSSSSSTFMNHVAASSSSIIKIERGTGIRRDSNANVTTFKSSMISSNESSMSGFPDQSSNYSSSTMSIQEHKNSYTLVSGVQKHMNKISEHQKETGQQPGPSGLNKRHSIDADTGISPYLKQSKPWNKYERSNEILLSNCSLNSSSSGSSSNSFENKNPPPETSMNGAVKWIMDSSQSSLTVASTHSESTSELSVLSVSNVMECDSKKPDSSKGSKASTGAIPKSISFDMTADKGDKYGEDDRGNKRGGFFGKLRMGFGRARRVKSFRNQDDYRMENSEEYSRKNQDSPMKVNNNIDLSDDILAKYRSKPYAESSPTKSIDGTQRKRHVSESTVVSNDGRNSFSDVKHKLRVVLGSSTVAIPDGATPARVALETALRLELGAARKTGASSSVAQLSEAIKCVRLLDDAACVRLIKTMRDDLSRRALYVEYLTSSRKRLLFSESFLDSLYDQISHEKFQCEEYLAVLYVHDFLQLKEAEMNEFCEEFKQLSLSDEKCDILNNFYSKLYRDMKGVAIWKDIIKGRKSTIKTALQRCIISRVYENALYPNGDGDKHRDLVLHEHIEKLSNIITPEHKYLMIQKVYLRECPWLPAQEALKAMGAYRAPKDKLSCVVRGAKCVMDLLSMAQNGSTTADDFTPVLVFVIIKSNPPDLLSTIQFVNSFYSNEICGEDQYWWTQFCAAVEFIKTMDYSD